MINSTPTAARPAREVLTEFFYHFDRRRLNMGQPQPQREMSDLDRIEYWEDARALLTTLAAAGLRIVEADQMEVLVCPACRGWFEHRTAMPDDRVRCPTCVYSDDRLYFYPTESDFLEGTATPERDDE